MKIGDSCFVHGYIDEIRKDTVIIKNKGGCFGTDPEEVIVVNDTEHPDGVPTIESRPRWIPVTERLPEEDVAVLVSYRYKEGEGDTSQLNINITSYGQMYFGGNKVEIHHWREPFKYFHNNYEVIAWMPLPEPYREER